MIVSYYKDKDGSYPVVDFIAQQDEDTQAKILRTIDLLEEFGLALQEPHKKKVTDSPLWELRTKIGTNIYRIFFGVKGEAVLLHGFHKKTQKTPPGELRAAEGRWEVHLANLPMKAAKKGKGKKAKR